MIVTTSQIKGSWVSGNSHYPFPITASFLHPEITSILTFMIISVLFFILSPPGQVIVYICLSNGNLYFKKFLVILVFFFPHSSISPSPVLFIVSKIVFFPHLL